MVKLIFMEITEGTQKKPMLAILGFHAKDTLISKTENIIMTTKGVSELKEIFIMSLIMFAPYVAFQGTMKIIVIL